MTTSPAVPHYRHAHSIPSLRVALSVRNQLSYDGFASIVTPRIEVFVHLDVVVRLQLLHTDTRAKQAEIDECVAPPNDSKPLMPVAQ